MSNEEEIYDGDYKWPDENVQTLKTIKLEALDSKSINSKILESKKDDSQNNQGKEVGIKTIEEGPAISNQDVKKLLQKIEFFLEEMAGFAKYTYDDKGKETIRRGRAHIYKFQNYYDISDTIKVSGITDPQDFDSPVYNIERIYEDLERYADIIHVINGGTKPLFCVVSHGGRTNFSKESIVFPGEIKDFYNVYELRLRSPEVGLKYRVTEYMIMDVSQTSSIPIEVANLHDESLPAVGTNWLDTDITPLTVPTTFRIQVSVSIAGNFFAVITKDGNEQVVLFNATAGPALVADGVYDFELLVHEGDTINFRYSTTGGTINILRAQEIDAAMA